MAAQQTVLRAELNDVPSTISGTTDLYIEYIGTYSYSGTGTNVDPYIGTINTIFRFRDLYFWNIKIENIGDDGTLYYEFDLPNYTGTTDNLYQYYNFTSKFNNAQPFIEYGVQNIKGSIVLNKNDIINFRANLRFTALNSTFKMYFVPDDVPENQLVTYEVLDLYSDIPITINKSFAELEDIGKRNSDYSVGLKLPGSKKNSRFFENFYDVDSSTLFFDVTKRVPIKVLIDDESYLTGYMRLNKVNVLDSKIEYDVTLFSNIGDLFGKIGNGLLKDLDFNDGEYHFNHYFRLFNIIGGWQLDYLQNQKNEFPLWVYPALHNGYLYDTNNKVNFSGGTVASQSRFYTSTVVGTYNNYAAFTGATGSEYYINSPKSPVLDNQLKPALSVFGLIKLMFKTYGYSIESEFFNTPWFKTLYTYGYFSSDTTKFGYQVQAPQTLPTEDVEILFVETFVDETVTCGGSPQIQTTRTYTIYVVKAGTGIPCLSSGVINANLKFRLFKCDSAIGTDYTQDIIIPANSTGTTYSWVSNGPYPIQPGVSSGCAPCAFEYQQNFVDLTTSNVGVTTRALAYQPQTPGTFVNYVENDAVNFNEVIDPKIKQIDFLSSIAKKYNLIFTIDPLDSTKIIIEPYDYYVGTGDVYDWTDKLSFDKGFSVEPALNYIESELLLTDQDDGDDGNKQFKDQNNRIYGENYVYNETDFKSQQKKIDTIFSPEIIRKWDSRIGMPLGINYAASSNLNAATNTVDYQYKGVKTKPKLMFYLGNFNPFIDQIGETYTIGTGTSINTMFFRLNESDGTNPLGAQYALINSANPIISHTMPIGNPDVNKINNDSLCILFNSEQPVDTIGTGIDSFNAYTDNDMYNNFYSNRVSNLYNKSTRFLSGNFYLQLSDIKNLKANDLIKIQNQYFTWNKIQQYNLTNKELTKVELIQYNSEHSIYPNRFFKYRYCGTSYDYKFRTYLNPAENPDTSNNNSLFYTNYFWSIFYDYMVGALGGNVSSITTSYLYSVINNYYRQIVTITEITENEYNTISYSNIDDPNNISFIGYKSGFAGGIPSTNLYFQNLFLYVWPTSSAYSTAFFNCAANCTDFIALCTANNIAIATPPIQPTPTPTPTPSSYILPTPTPSVTRTPAICITHTPTPTVTSTVTPTVTSTITPTITPTITTTPTITPTNTITPTPTVTPSSTPVPCVQLQTDTVYVYEYGLSGNTNTLLFDPATELINDIAIGNSNFYTLINTDAFQTGYTINQYTSTLSPLSITTGVTDTWTFYDGDYPGLDGSAGLEIKDSNTLLIGGSSIYELNLSGSTYTKLFDLAYPDTFVIGDFIYNPYTNRIIMLAYGQSPYTTYNITEYYMNGTIYATYEFTYDFGTYFFGGLYYDKVPTSLLVNNNNLYIVTDWNSDIYLINLSTGAPTYVQSITGSTYDFCSGFGAPNQCNNVSLSPSPTFTPTPTVTPTITLTPSTTPSVGDKSLEIYGRDIAGTRATLTLFYSINGGANINVPGYTGSQLPSSCTLLYTITGLTVSDNVTIGTSTNCVMTGNASSSSCPSSSGSFVDYTYAMDAPTIQQIAITIDSDTIP